MLQTFISWLLQNNYYKKCTCKTVHLKIELQIVAQFHFPGGIFPASSIHQVSHTEIIFHICLEVNGQLIRVGGGGKGDLCLKYRPVNGSRIPGRHKIVIRIRLKIFFPKSDDAACCSGKE